MECREARKQIVLPVFYDVTPNQVQHQTGSYASAFRQHAKKQDTETVQRWREALTEVGSLKGWELRNEANGHQGKLIKMIVTKVLKEPKKAHLCAGNNLVGIDDKVKAVMEMLAVDAPDVRFIGIWGMGGIGKTTLAKVIYNRILDDFDGCSFLQDVRETLACSHNGHQQLQSQLVADLLRCDRQDFATVDEGMYVLKRRFCEMKVLILLDDVDRVDQLSALAADVDCNSSRSERTVRDIGYWKVTSKPKEVKSEAGSNVIGNKNILTFYEGRHPKGVKTDWILHEYHLNARCLGYYDITEMPFVVCRLQYKGCNLEESICEDDSTGCVTSEMYATTYQQHTSSQITSQEEMWESLTPIQQLPNHLPD